MQVKKIKVTKNGVIKEVQAHQEKDYVKNGWFVFKDDAYKQKSTINSILDKRIG